MSNSVFSGTEVTSSLHILYLQHCCQFATLVVVLYDHIITFDSELELIWQKRWSKSKVLYILCRYVGDVMMTGETFVYLNQNPTYTLYVIYGSIFRFIDWMGHALLLGSQLRMGHAKRGWIGLFIMQLRIQALYNNSLLSKILFGIFLGEIVGLTTLGSFAWQGIEMTTEPLPGIHLCAPAKFPSYSFMFWVIFLSFDTILFLLALGIVFQRWQTWRGLPREATKFRTRPSLMTILLRDNLGYFFLAVGIYLMATIVWLAADAPYFGIPACFSYSMTVILGCRLILNLCDAYYNPPSFMSRGLSEWDTQQQIGVLKFDHRHSSMTLTQYTNQNIRVQSGEIGGGLGIRQSMPGIGDQIEICPVLNDVDDV